MDNDWTGQLLLDLEAYLERLSFTKEDAPGYLFTDSYYKNYVAQVRRINPKDNDND